MNPYKLLGVTNTASDQDIKKAFRTASCTCHPDRVAEDDPNRDDLIEKFTDLSEAKDMLLDPDLRKAYDRGGWDMVNHVTESRRIREQRALKCEPLFVNREISIEQLYNRDQVKIEVSVPIYESDGNVRHTTFPMEFQENLGKIIAQNVGVQRPDQVPGDIVVLTQLDDKCPFEIKGLDLVYIAKLNLLDLLRGYKIIIPHPEAPYLLTGRYKNSRNEDDNVYIFPKKGLSATHNRGNLVVLVTPDIESICNLDKESADAICDILDTRMRDTDRATDAKAESADIADITDEACTPEQMQNQESGDIDQLMQRMIQSMDAGNRQNQGPGPGCPIQ